MASKNSKVLDKVFKKTTKSVDAGISKALKVIVKEAPEQVKKRTQLGGGVVVRDKKTGFGGKRIKLDGLKRSTIERRSRYKSGLSNKTTPRKSNLTATGQLLESLEGRIRPGNKIRVTPTGKRAFELDGSKSRLDNKKLREYVEEKRPFLGLTDAEVNKMTRIAREIILKEIRK